MQAFWGIDLGGTKLEGVVLTSLEDPTPLCRIRIDTEAEKGYEHILDRIGLLLEELKKASDLTPSSLGVGHPGVLDPQSKLIKNSNTVCLNGKPLKQDLERRLGFVVQLANDANCFALAESRYGAGKDARVVFGVILGTGVGGGIVINHEVLVGHQGIAGEWGHNILVPEGPKCYCGKLGCVESIISGPALESFYQGLSGERRKLAEIILRAHGKDDVTAKATLDRLCQFFGRAIAVVINVLDPDVVVLGGGLSNVQELYSNGRAAAAGVVINDRLETPIVRNELGDSAGVFGAALLTA